MAWNSLINFSQTAFGGQLLIVQGRRITRENDLTGQVLQQPQQFQVIVLLVLEPVAPIRAARRVQVRGVAVHELPALVGKVRKEPVRAPVHQLHRVVALEPRQRPRIEIDADITERRGLSLHDRPRRLGGSRYRCRAGASAR